MGEATGGFWVLVLDPFLLQQVSSTFYGTNSPDCTSTTSAAQVQLMANDLANITAASTGFYCPAGGPTCRILYHCRLAFNSTTVETDFQGSPAFQIVNSVWSMGISWYSIQRFNLGFCPIVFNGRCTWKKHARRRNQLCSIFCTGKSGRVQVVQHHGGWRHRCSKRHPEKKQPVSIHSE